MIKAIIFDCFGVLYPDTSISFFENHKDRFGGKREVFDDLNFQIDFGNITSAEFFSRLEKETGLPAKDIEKEWNQEIVVNRRLVEFMRKLKGKYKIGLLSNAGEEEMHILYRDKIDELFDSKTISYEAGCVKPNEEIFLISVRRLGLEPSECILFDDRIVNIEAAQKVGMKAALYSDFDTFEQKFESYLS